MIELLKNIDRIDIISAINKRLKQIGEAGGGSGVAYEAGPGINISDDNVISVDIDEKLNGYVENPLYVDAAGLRYNSNFFPQFWGNLQQVDGSGVLDLREQMYAMPMFALGLIHTEYSTGAGTPAQHATLKTGNSNAVDLEFFMSGGDRHGHYPLSAMEPISEFDADHYWFGIFFRDLKRSGKNVFIMLFDIQGGD